MSKKWEMWTLSEEDIEFVAQKNGLVVKPEELDDVVRLTKKGFEANNWEEIILNAIEGTKRWG